MGSVVQGGSHRVFSPEKGCWLGRTLGWLLALLPRKAGVRAGPVDGQGGRASSPVRKGQLGQMVCILEMLLARAGRTRLPVGAERPARPAGLVTVSPCPFASLSPGGLLVPVPQCFTWGTIEAATQLTGRKARGRGRWHCSHTFATSFPLYGAR